MISQRLKDRMTRSMQLTLTVLAGLPISCTPPECTDSPTATPVATPTPQTVATPTTGPTPTLSPTPAPTPATSCGDTAGLSWNDVVSSSELKVRWTDVQPQFGSCVAIEVENLGGDKSSFAVYLNVNTPIESLSHFEGGSFELAGSRLVLHPYPGEVLSAGAKAQFCYCSNPGRAYPSSSNSSTQHFPGATGSYIGLTPLQHTYQPVTIENSTVGVVLDGSPVRDVRGVVSPCANLTFTNISSGALNLDKVELTLNGSGVSPKYWPEFVSVNEGGNQVTVDFPSAWMPLEAGASLPLTLCLGGRMPAGAQYTLAK